MAIKRFRVWVKPNDNPNGWTPRAEEVLGPIHNTFFNFGAPGLWIPMLPMWKWIPQAFAYEYFYNGRELTFSANVEDKNVDDIAAMFQSVYHVVNIEEIDSQVAKNKDAIINGTVHTEYTTLAFAGACKEAMPYYKHLGNDYLQLILTQLIKNKLINVGYKINFYPSNNDWKHDLKKYDKSMKNSKKGWFFDWNGKESVNLAEIEWQMLQKMAEKMMVPMSYFTEIQIIAWTADPKLKNEVAELVKALTGRLSELNLAVINTSFSKTEFINNYLNNSISQKAMYNGSILNTQELVTIIHPPVETNTKTPNLGIDKFKKVPLPKELIGKEGIFVWENSFGNKKFDFRMWLQERFRHQYIIGQTGTWKSVLLTSQALQDIYNGDGVCVVDPHWDLIEDILEHYPKERLKDLVLFDPADTERPPGFNIMDLEDDFSTSLFMNYFIWMIKKMYEKEEGATGPHFEDYMKTAIWTLYRMKSIYPPTVADIWRFLTHDEFLSLGEKMLDPELDIDTIGYWKKHRERIEAGADYAQEIIPYITTKLTAFVKNMLIKNIVCQEISTIDVEDIMNNKKVLLLKLSKGTIQEENMRMLWLLFVQKIAMATFKRDKMPKDKRVPFFLYVDEFQNFITNEYAQILSEARKYKLWLTMAHQFVSQLVNETSRSEEVKNAVFWNVGTMIAFRIWGKDSEEMESVFANKNLLTKEDFSNIDNFNAYVKTVNFETAQAITPFSIKTKMLKYPYNWNSEQVEKIKEFSKKKYCWTKEWAIEHDKKFAELFS